MYIAYTIDTAAEHSNISAGTITLAIRDRHLPAHRIDGRAIILPEALHAWISSHPRF